MGAEGGHKKSEGEDGSYYSQENLKGTTHQDSKYRNKRRDFRGKGKVGEEIRNPLQAKVMALRQ